jgi:hypothetical protein
MDKSTPAGAYDLQAYVFELPGYSAAPLLDPVTGEQVRVNLGTTVLGKAGELDQNVRPWTPSMASFEVGIDLLSAEASCVFGGTTCAVDLRWRKTSESPGRYTVFVHLVDDTGKLLGQSDSFLLDGRLPTDLWPTGYQVTEHREVTLSGIPRTPVTARVGLYLVETGRRAHLNRSGQAPAVDYASLPVGSR